MNEEREILGTATYCPEDNKLRFTAFERLSPEVYSRFKTNGFKWAPKQGIFVCPRWTPSAEDLLLEYCEEIADEDYSPEERAADRAERYSGYREKRRGEAGDYADTYEAGPTAFGNQNKARAERQAARHDRSRTKSVCQWGKAEYWQSRTKRVISQALHKSSAPVRRSRILRLEAEQRKHLKEIEQARTRWGLWKKIADQPDPEQATKWAIALSGNSTGWTEYQHPRNPERESSLWSLLTQEEDPITGHEAAALYFGKREKEPGSEGTYAYRWTMHYDLRLTYENAMLENEGGKASEIEMVVGGFTKYGQIFKINKSPTTGKIVSLQVYGLKGKSYYYDRERVPGLLTINIQRKGDDIGYRAPTPEELEAFHAARKAEKAEAKKTTPKAPSLINPTDEDAQRLQDIWNRKSAELYAKHCSYGRGYEPTQVKRMTQAQYSERSKGTYSHCEAINLCSDGTKPEMHYGEEVKDDSRPIVCKVRRRFSGGNFSHQAHAVIVITDKPQKPLPIHWGSTENATAETFTPLSN